MSDRLETLKQMLAQDPANDFVRYALGMEYAGAGEWRQAAEQFQALLERNPDYAAAYFQLGQMFEKLGLLEQARQTYRRGIQVHERQGNQHARRELEAALELLE